MKQTILTVTLLAMSFSNSAQEDTRSYEIDLQWELEYSLPGSNSSKTCKAIVPGAVQLDIAREEGYGDYFYAENWKDYKWMEDESFTYISRFETPELKRGEKLLFCSEGIDYKFEIIFNGELIHEQEGMFTPVKVDITNKPGTSNELRIKIFPSPKAHEIPEDRTQANQSTKPAASYGWDWHPRLIPGGIWDHTCLEIVPEQHITNTYLRYSLNDDLSAANIEYHVSGSDLKKCRADWQLLDKNGKEVLSESIEFETNVGKILTTLKDPELWWTHDHGSAYLYTSVIKLYDQKGNKLQAISEKTGFRSVKLIMNEGAWKEPVDFPKSRSAPPIQLELNGRKIFAKGTNWVQPEIFPGIITAERYDELTDRAVEANFNILRVWGGGIVNKRAFYEQCDEKGILVWQEFPLACNNYGDSPEYLAILEQEARSIVTRIRKHPSLAMWSGGNELFNSWGGMTEQSKALRTLNSICLELDPETPFINTSPLMGMGHGHYVFRDPDTGEEVYSIMNRARFTAYTEFGMPAPSPIELLRTIIPEEEIWPPKAGTSWESHHAFNAWVGDTWLMQDMIEHYFGPSNSLESLVKNGQKLQAEGYKAIYEEARRQKPYCSMALNWCYNEPWPTAANNSIINWPNTPKPGFFAVKDACRPVMTSARINQLEWTTGKSFETDLYLLNDSFESVPASIITVKLISGNKEWMIHKWECPGTDPGRNIAGPTVRMELPKVDDELCSLLIEAEGFPEYNSEYLIIVKEGKNSRVSKANLNQ